jgi:lipoprotein NlpD
LYCLLLGACADTAADGPERYVVRPEDTLYSIAWRHDLDFRDLARWNNIGADFRISVGQVLVLGPGRAASPERATPHAAPKPAPAAVMPPPATLPSTTSPPSATPQVSKPRPLPEPAAAAPNTGAPNSGAPNGSASHGSASNSHGAPSPPSNPTGERNTQERWIWPTDRVGAPRVVPGGGILLSGRLGQDVRAASAGRVVYTGSGLRGYGNLVIIKHADSLLSAYAHNREMLVHDGQEVAMGQVIAHMGEGAHQSPVLYFEIRQNGKPVDPLPFLSR